ncbi:MAG: hypothetical protein LWX07_00635 [Bacteroidetes bacterium]|nr:hypothetical protein [Bacteroidota bacterium]
MLIFLPSLILGFTKQPGYFCVNDSDKTGGITTVEIATKTGKSFLVRCVPESEYLFDVYITGKGFPESRDTILFDEIEHIDTIFTADLDNDGFEEMYLFTRGFKPGEYAHIFGIASDGDMTFKEINFPAIKPGEINTGGPFEGYNGRDVFIIKNNVLERTFPVHRPGDTYENPGLGYKTLYYTIEKSAEGFFYKRKD